LASEKGYRDPSPGSRLPRIQIGSVGCAMKRFEFRWRSEDELKLYSPGWAPETEPKAVVCHVHGLEEHSGRYAHVAAFLNQAGYSFLGFDLRGHGRSEGQRGHSPSYDALMGDISCFLEETGRKSKLKRIRYR
jgi:alpha-beta hydrolase superfamily lysophospholipase